VYVAQIAGPGTLQLRNPSASADHPSLTYDFGPNGGDAGPWGTVITATVDVGSSGTQWVVGKANRNDVSRYAGDLRFDAPLTGSATLRFVGLSRNNSRNVHFVLNADNSGPGGFTGAVQIANCDLALANDNALTAANAVTFDNTVDPNTLNLGTLYLYGHDVTIGSLNDTSAPGTSSFIRNGALDLPFGGTNSNHNPATFGVALGLQADSTLTINQTVDGAFNGQINDGPNDNGTGDSGPYRTLSVVVTGSATLTETGSNGYTGTTTVSGGTLLVNGSLTATSATTIANGATLGGTGAVASPVTVNGTLAPGAANLTGQLLTNGLTFGTGSAFQVAINGPGAGTGYDQAVVFGPINLAGASLNVSLGNGFVPDIGSSFVLVANGGGIPIAGTFAGLPEGATTTVGGLSFRITYRGGDTGQNVVLTRIA
jgi:autotransporter-associated beta strand protein